jgi:hypothetical protein
VTSSSTKKAVVAIKSLGVAVVRIGAEQRPSIMNERLVNLNAIDNKSDDYPTLEPNDSLFRLWVGTLIVLILIASRLGKFREGDKASSS